MFLVINEITFITSPIRPSKCSLPLHFVVKPIPVVHLSVLESHRALALDLVVDELSFVDIVVFPLKPTMPMLHPIFILPKLTNEYPS